VPSFNLSLSQPVINVVPGDFNHDGKLDVLVMMQEAGGWWGQSDMTIMGVYLGGSADGGFRELFKRTPSLTADSFRTYTLDHAIVEREPAYGFRCGRQFEAVVVGLFL
jgi:integrin alpha FG-GAP repeat containing protein 1